MSYCPPQVSEKNTCSTAPPDAPYNSPHNTNYAVYQVLPTNPYTGATNPTYTQYNSLPNNKPFTLNPQYPLNQGSNASQLVNIQEAKVYLSIMPDERSEEVFNFVNKSIYGIQQDLNKRLRMRPVPKIIFQREGKTKQAARIEEILEEIKEEEH